MTDCARCGDCCQNVHLSTTKKALRTSSDPSAAFVLAHWHRSGGGGTGTLWTCDRLNLVTRLCEAHGERPPLCQGFPWYGGDVVPDRLTGNRCSFWADVPVDQRPAEWVPVAIRSAS